MSLVCHKWPINPHYSWKNMNNDDNLLKTSVIQ